MTIEEKIFARKRFSAEKMTDFGFTKTPGGYEYTADFMKGDFWASVFVSDAGAVSGRVVDKMNDEEYTPLRAEGFNGAYVNSVRSAYEEFLSEIAQGCCSDVLFACDQANRLCRYIHEKYSVKPDFPFGKSQYESYGTFRHTDNKKWFALIMNVKWDVFLKNGDKNTVDIVNLKIPKGRSEELCKRDGIYPAYHMNRTHWISVVLDDRLRDDEVTDLLDQSFDLTK